MFMLIAVLIPSVVGVKIIDYLVHGLNLKRTIYWFAILLLISTCLNNIIVYLAFGLDSNILSHLNNLPIFFCKYVLISFIINIVMAFGIVVCMKNFSIEIKKETIKEEKSVKKNTKVTKKRNTKSISK